MPSPTLTVRNATAVYVPARSPADRRLTTVHRIDEPYAEPAFDSLAAWEQRKAALRRQILVAAGLWPEPVRTPLDAQLGAISVEGDYAVQTVAFQSRPGFYVTGNLYRPLDIQGRVPAVLNPHGHSRRGRLEHTDNSSTPARCTTFARQGYLAFAYDMVGYNDAHQIPHHFGDARDWLWSLGALGLQLWNSIRALDFVLALPEVDADRIGCVGESGGGTQTFLLAAVDDRVGYLAPVVMVSAHYQGGCVCENAPGLRLGTSNVEIAAMAAPRPMTLVSATGDWTRNTPTVEFPAIRRVYALYGAADRLSQEQIAAPHNFNRESREAVYRFFSHWFQGTPPEHQEEPALTLPPEQTLRVFPDALPPDALDSSGLRAATRRSICEQLSALAPRDQQTEAVFRATVGDAYRLALGAAPAAGSLVIERAGEHRFGARSTSRLLLGHTERGERVPALFFAGDAAARPLVLIHSAGKAAFFIEAQGVVEAGELLGGILAGQRPVLLIDPFLTGDYQTPYAQSGRDQASPHFLTFNLADSVLRVQDVVTAVAALKQLTGVGEVDLLGLEEGGLWSVLARPLVNGVRLLVASGAGLPANDEDGYLRRLFIPGLLRCGGLETALLLAAPQRACLFDFPSPAVAERVAGWYTELGHNDRFRSQVAPLSTAELLATLARDPG